MMKKNVPLLDQEHFLDLYCYLTQDQNLEDALVEMQCRQGICQEKAKENADAVMYLVAHREGFFDLLSKDAGKVLDVLLEKSSALQGEDRKRLLHQLRFGLMLHQEGDLITKREKTPQPETLFEAYYAEASGDPAWTEAALEADIRSRISGYPLSPEAMRAFARKLERSGEVLTTAAALSEQGSRFKCMAAMELYLQNPQRGKLSEAVNTACMDTELAAMADAAAHGQITQERCKEYLALLIVAGILVGTVLLIADLMLDGGAVTATAVSSAGSAVTAGSVGHGLYQGSALTLMTGEALYRWAGIHAAEKRYLRNIGGAEAAKALQEMADRTQKEAKQPAAAAGKDRTQTARNRESVRPGRG